jgi:hypothetical protein
MLEGYLFRAALPQTGTWVPFFINTDAPTPLTEPEKTVRIEVTLTQYHAWALAEFCNRLSIYQCCKLADSEDHALAMHDAVKCVARALHTRGCYPFYTV